VRVYSKNVEDNELARAAENVVMHWV
jgi:hypothetical protein